MSTKEISVGQVQRLEMLVDAMQEADDNRSVVETRVPPFPANGELKSNQLRLFRIKKLSYDGEFPHREAFENVLATMDNPSFNFVYVLTGTETGIELDVGVVQNTADVQSDALGKKLAASDYGEIIKSAIEGNFNGSVVESLSKDEIDTIMNGATIYTDAGLITGVPSMNEKEVGEKTDFQGIDRLINSMLGLEWRLVVVCTRVQQKGIGALRNEIRDLYNYLSVYAKQTIQQSANSGENYSESTNYSKADGTQSGYSTTTGRNKGWSKGTSDGDGSGYSTSHGTSGGESASKTKTGGTSETITKGTGENKGWNKGRGTAVTVEMSNKYAQEWMKYIDEELIERYKLGASKGLFLTSVYYMATKPSDANRLGAGLLSLFQGSKATNCPLSLQKIDVTKNRAMLRLFQNSYTMPSIVSADSLALKSRPHGNGGVGLSTYMTAAEVALFAGLPQNEVPGLALTESVHFGLNERDLNKRDASGEIKLGCMVQNGRELKNLPFAIPRSSLNKHVFVAGVTGSGKTTTCHKMLTEADMPFLVIEPAKTEYRRLINEDEDIIVFTLGNVHAAPLCLNPFEMLDSEILSSHIDMLKATFTSAFPMEASMPQILEEAMYNCYKKKGWNIQTGAYKGSGDDKFPILSDLLHELNMVVEEKKFGRELEGNYKGSLVSRVSHLTVGAKGSMLNCLRSTDFRALANKKVILELEAVKSPEDKAFLMGLILARLSETVKAEHADDNDYRHITLVEEAHRLLSKPDIGDSGARKAAVETFADLLAEVRKYGESLIIVDQIPNKLAPDVLKNTNTKIIHKILARDDKEAVGDCMLMDDKQKAYLSALETGSAIVFNEYTDKPVQVKIEMMTDTSGKDPKDEAVKERFESKKAEFGACYADMEILKHSETFDDVCKKLKDAGNETCSFEELPLYEELRANVSDTAQKTGCAVSDIYKALIQRRESENGKGMNSSDKERERRGKLTDFFAINFHEQKTTTKDVENIFSNF